jgi:uncharacterized protein (DUF2147 family)
MHILLVAALLASAPSFSGDWITADQSAVVRIGPCGAGICGHIVRVLASGAPGSDVNNPDRALRSRPLAGVAVLSGFTPAGSGGRAYDPKTGRSYSASLHLNADGTLRVTGCVTIICRSQVWTRRH